MASAALMVAGIGVLSVDARNAVADAECVASVCVPSTPLSPPGAVTYDNGKQVFNVKAFGAKGDGKTDDTVAIKAADNAAEQAGGGVVWFPGGTFLFSSQLTVHGSWRGAGIFSSTLLITKSLGTRVPAVVVPTSASAPGRTAVLSDLAIKGPRRPPKGGPATADLDGLRLDRPVFLERVKVTHFDAGIVLNSPSGRIDLDNVKVGDNLYGIYDVSGGPDNRFSDSFMEGNALADIASPSSTTITRLRVDRSHFGFGPYVFYQEAGPSATGLWLDQVDLQDAKYEQVGNGVFFSENAATGGGGVKDLRNVSSDHTPGVGTWGPAPGRSTDYVMTFGTATGSMYFRENGHVMNDGAVGLLYVQNNQASWRWTRRTYGGLSAHAPTITVASGRQDTFDIRSTKASERRGAAIIPVGQTSTTVVTDANLSYLGPVESIKPVLQPNSSGGLSAFTLVVSNVTSTPDGATQFVVSVVGGTPTKDLAFTWAITTDTQRGNGV